MREQLIQDMEKAIAEVRQWPKKEVQIFHHNDSDGLSSGAILTRAFERAGFEIRRFSLEKPYPALLKKVYEQEGGLIVFADFAGRIAHTGPAMAGSDDKFGAPGHGTDDGQIVLTDGSKSRKKSQCSQPCNQRYPTRKRTRKFRYFFEGNAIFKTDKFRMASQIKITTGGLLNV